MDAGIDTHFILAVNHHRPGLRRTGGGRRHAVLLDGAAQQRNITAWRGNQTIVNQGADRSDIVMDCIQQLAIIGEA